eukprot:CAMPEP_0206027968 /NCGR_PEP_ID=MMETSP1464-20131121/44133_1 /ASSEMBLY_ACC=CAM_ASM_001124 /TAXON_ID=119497 /ORGANISM="Exanthemachrysis gayraliae, Strain RCC1523" /LENGTH=94 /DNA_ID=CAMNT_0053402017 /DNA_START=57 /DNA_END=337 /DNA_ORIENTATION=+
MRGLSSPGLTIFSWSSMARTSSGSSPMDAMSSPPVFVVLRAGLGAGHALPLGPEGDRREVVPVRALHTVVVPALAVPLVPAVPALEGVVLPKIL